MKCKHPCPVLNNLHNVKSHGTGFCAEFIYIKKKHSNLALTWQNIYMRKIDDNPLDTSKPLSYSAYLHIHNGYKTTNYKLEYRTKIDVKST